MFRKIMIFISGFASVSNLFYFGKLIFTDYVPSKFDIGVDSFIVCVVMIMLTIMWIKAEEIKK